MCCAARGLMWMLLGVSGVMLIAGGEAVAAEDDADSAAQRRIMHRFHFNERELGNFEPMPMNWYRVTRPGFPRYTEIGFDDRHATVGERSVKLQLNGGSAAITLASGTLAVMPGARYLLTANVRTADADRSRARVTAVFVDEHNQPLLQTRTTSPLVIANDDWRRVRLEPPRVPDEAAWLVLRLEMLQPQEFRQPTLGVHELIKQDIHAAAWFDDVTIYQLPRIELSTRSATTIVREPEAVELDVSVQDLTGDELQATVIVYDAAGEPVAEQRRSLDDAHPGQWRFTPELPRFGWYWAEVEVRDEQTLIGHAYTAVSYLPRRSGRGSGEADRFMLLLDDVPADYRDLVPDMMHPLGDQAVQVSLWHEEITQDELAGATGRPDPLIAALLDQDRTVAIALGKVPQHLALQAGIDVGDPLALFANVRDEQGERDGWRAVLMAMLANYGHRIDQWHIGLAGNDRAFWRDDLPAVHRTARELFGRYVAAPEIVIPWQATQGLTAESEQIGSLLMDLPASIRPEQIPAYLETWQNHPARHTVHLRSLDADGGHSHADRAADLALRMIHAWQDPPDRLALSNPWRYAEGPPRALLSDPLLGVWSHVAGQLADRRFVGQLDLGPGIEARLLDGAGGGVLVAWNASAPRDEAELDLYLGEEPVVVDLYGNREPVEREGDRHRLQLTQTPLFIEGVDMALARLRTGFALDEPFIPSVHSRHERTLRLRNPWQRTISGRLRFTGPERWEVQPGVTRFTIPAGETLDIPLTLTFPISELAGRKRLRAEVRIDADQTYEVELDAPMTVGLEEVEFHATTSAEADDAGGAADAVVTAVVTNLGEAARSFYAFAMAPGHPRNERIISQLEPGQTIVRRFRFPEAADDLSGEHIRVGLRETDGPAVLNNRVQVP